MTNKRWLGFTAVILVLAGAAALRWWPQPSSSPSPTHALPETPPTATPRPASSVAASTASGIQHPVEVPGTVSGATDPKSVLTDLFGRRATLSMFHLDDFPRRFAATVDNLGRSSAPANVWPVVPTAGQFLSEPG